MKYKATQFLVILVLCALSVEAQSGRRKIEPPPAAPVPTPTPEPTPSPKKELAPDFLFLVVTDRDTANASLPLSFHTVAQRGCAERLRTRSNSEVDAPHGDMGRGQAVEKAKSSPNTHVVFLTLQFASMPTSSNELQLDFTVFAPTTAKVLIAGRSYINANRAGPVVVGRQIPSGMFREAWIREAGEEAADKILKRVQQNVPPTK